tara:strand:+ start:2814 stop:3008 length:195 start_codon:yes stop_codon:yes gene_type:complete
MDKTIELLVAQHEIHRLRDMSIPTDLTAKLIEAGIEPPALQAEKLTELTQTHEEDTLNEFTHNL